MSETKGEDDSDSVVPAKQAKLDTSLASAFSGLKKSEFYQEPSILPGPSKSAPNSKPKSSLLVSPKQKGNPLLKFIRNVPWEYSNIVPDYVMGKTTCALFLSIKYHQLNPDYIHDRLKLLGNAFNLRVLLVQVDIADPQHALKHLTRICILADLTLMLAWNAEDAGKIVETYNAYENKPPDAIMERSEGAPYQKIANALTTIKSVNKTDATTLLSCFDTLEGIVKATPHSLALCTGIGLNKAQKIYNTLHESFLKSDTSKK